jgi:hypothetical protein
MTNKVEPMPIEAQKIIFDFFKDADDYEMNIIKTPKIFEAMSQFSTKIAPWLESPFVPDFLKPLK